MKHGFRLYALLVLVYNLAVIVWGAFVRATGAGAGCGSHWPACNGVMIPRDPSVETMIEYTHRATSALALLAVIGLLWFARKVFEPGHRVRVASWATVILMVVEALLGAGLVIFGWVADDASVGRAVMMPIHLLNTFLLLAANALAWYWAGGAGAPRPRGVVVPLALGLALLSTALLGATGAVSALGDTLFPAESLRAGMAQDFQETSHFLLRLRVIHPFLALLVGGLVTFVAMAVPARVQRPAIRRMALGLVVLFVAQLGVGVVNLVLLAPVTMQLVHLALADVVWVALVVFSAAATAREAPAVEAEGTGPVPAVA